MPLGGWWIRATAGPIIPAWRKNAKPESMIAVPAQKCQNRVYDQKCTKIHKNQQKSTTKQKPHKNAQILSPGIPPEFPQNPAFVPLCPALSRFVPRNSPGIPSKIPLCPALSRFVPLCPALSPFSRLLPVSPACSGFMHLLDGICRVCPSTAISEPCSWCCRRARVMKFADSPKSRS